jgi:hypothetical protein
VTTDERGKFVSAYELAMYRHSNYRYTIARISGSVAIDEESA